MKRQKDGINGYGRLDSPPQCFYIIPPVKPVVVDRMPPFRNLARSTPSTKRVWGNSQNICGFLDGQVRYFRRPDCGHKN